MIFFQLSKFSFSLLLFELFKFEFNFGSKRIKNNRFSSFLLYNIYLFLLNIYIFIPLETRNNWRFKWRLHDIFNTFNHIKASDLVITRSQIIKCVLGKIVASSLLSCLYSLKESFAMKALIRLVQIIINIWISDHFRWPKS